MLELIRDHVIGAAQVSLSYYFRALKMNDPYRDSTTGRVLGSCL